MNAASRTYLDHNATSALRPDARDAMLAALEHAGNASSVHAEGRAARALIERAREEVAALVGGQARNVVFTSGGTEANVLALTPGLEACGDKRPLDRLLTSAVEHPSVLDGARFPADRVERLPVDGDGVLDLDALSARLAVLAKAGERALVSVQAANNETGVLQPIAAIAGLVHDHGGLLHCDAVQAAGRTDFAMASGADLVTLSAHKIGGPQGVGALVLSPAVTIADRVLRGGGQERGARAGTENVAGIAGFGAAASCAREGRAEEAARLAALRDVFEAGLRAVAPDIDVFGARVGRLPNTTLFAMPEGTAETALIAFDLAGVAVSSGAACSSGKVRASHVLLAMGVPRERAAAAIRVSLGWTTTRNHIENCLEVFEKTVGALRNRRGRAA
ncbi:cysteine desulfurase [Alsobacter sp. SYSU M60028]|uniref:Cysteine desulfurase n=1 Tax=Alsobacter ponti TaxID=2962936 RepID=A0ABT1LFL9_9HYPH|nr:cysteine desulfurase family protein [Alsobacter ponti]MCP8940285.1 cysteine desulfurase [Alsobacter ponti]